MIDRKARTAVRDAIENYLHQRIDNGELERRMFSHKTNDVACREIAWQMTYFSSEYERHMNEGSSRISNGDSRIVARWLAFLSSDAEWPIQDEVRRSVFQRVCRVVTALFSSEGDVPKFRVNEFWPFTSLDEWRSILSRVSEIATSPS